MSALFSIEGFPEAIVMDNSPQFKPQIFETFLFDRNIQHLCSSNYYSQANGQVERFNSVSKEQIQFAQLECCPVKCELLRSEGVARSCTTAHATFANLKYLIHRSSVLLLPLDEGQCIASAVEDIQADLGSLQLEYLFAHTFQMN